MWWTREQRNDLVEFVRGIALILMSIDARLEVILDRLEDGRDDA